MCPQDEEFLTRLLLTFSEEATDHLQVIISGIITLEKDDTLIQTAEIEPVYRATHSLKGAARAVGLKEIETVCQHLESIFSAVRKGDFILHSEEFNLIHQVISTLESLLAGDKQVKTGELISKLKNIIPLQKTFQTSEPTPSELPVPQSPATPAPLKPGDEEQKISDLIPGPSDLSNKIAGQKIPVPPAKPAKVAGYSTIRISEERLTTLYETADDLLSYRMSSDTRLSDLKEIAHIVRNWRWSMNRVEGDVAELKRQVYGNQVTIDRLFSFIDSTRDLMGSCETRLDSTIKSMVQDQYEMDSVITGLIESIREVVLVPVSSLTDTYPRMIRDIANEQGKRVKLQISGSGIEIDRRILEAVKDPLVHLLRNAIDHGIESPDSRVQQNKPPEGSLSVDIVHDRANQITVTISDDGRGIDPVRVGQAAVEKGIIAREELAGLMHDDIIRLIFRSGLSTSESVSTISGRGLGLAIVQEKINQIGGSTDLVSVTGRETRFILTIPITLATFRGILVYAENRPFFLPLDRVERVLIPDASDITTIEGRSVLCLGDQLIPVGMLSTILNLSTSASDTREVRSVVLIKNLDKRFGLIVNQIAGAQEIVVRDLGPQLKEVRFVSGVAILNNNLIVPVLQVDDIEQALQGQHISSGVMPELPSSLSGKRKIMIVEDSITSRMLLKNILEGAGYDVETAVDGLDAFTRLKTNLVDIVVSDVDMPRMNGFVLTEKIRSEKKLSDLPVILVTSLDSREDREHGITVGANAYIIKSSFDQGNLLEVITRLIGKGRQ